MFGRPKLKQATNVRYTYLEHVLVGHKNALLLPGMVVHFELLYIGDPALDKPNSWCDVVLVEQSHLLVHELIGLRLLCVHDAPFRRQLDDKPQAKA